jgi:hypothetical protein
MQRIAKIKLRISYYSYNKVIKNFVQLFQSKDGKTPLHMTALHGRFSRSQTIIQSGKKYFCLFFLFLKCSKKHPQMNGIEELS